MDRTETPVQARRRRGVLSRTLPAGSTFRSYNPHEATVAVCSGFLGLTGKGVSEIPVETNWFTVTVILRWTSDGRRLADSEDPTPAEIRPKLGVYRPRSNMASNLLTISAECLT